MRPSVRKVLLVTVSSIWMVACGTWDDDRAADHRRPAPFHPSGLVAHKAVVDMALAEGNLRLSGDHFRTDGELLTVTGGVDAVLGHIRASSDRAQIRLTDRVLHIEGNVRAQFQLPARAEEDRDGL